MTTPSYVGGGEIGTANQRAARRAEIRRRVLANAEQDAYRNNRSYKCGVLGHHAKDQRYDYCRNDGSTCICECHDPKRAGE